jgi:hypothetical protein
LDSRILTNLGVCCPSTAVAKRVVVAGGKNIPLIERDCLLSLCFPSHLSCCHITCGSVYRVTCTFNFNLNKKQGFIPAI